MKKLFHVFIAGVILVSCGNGGKEKTETANSEAMQNDRVEVLYFHGAQRCITCRAIETNTKALLDNLYSKEIASGRIVYRIIAKSHPDKFKNGIKDKIDELLK